MLGDMLCDYTRVSKVCVENIRIFERNQDKGSAEKEAKNQKGEPPTAQIDLISENAKAIVNVERTIPSESKKDLSSEPEVRSILVHRFNRTDLNISQRRNAASDVPTNALSDTTHKLLIEVRGANF